MIENKQKASERFSTDVAVQSKLKSIKCKKGRELELVALLQAFA
jgi:hypothetical protein